MKKKKETDAIVDDQIPLVDNDASVLADDDVAIADDTAVENDPLTTNEDAIALQNTILALTKERDHLAAQIDGFKDQSLRSLAELENVKRRKEQEKTDAIRFANERLIVDLLPSIDAYDLAMIQLEHADSNEAASESQKAMIAGFEMIRKQLGQFLVKCGVQKIEAIDKPFDPAFHQAISQETHADKAANTVIKEMQAGYLLNDRVIRPSMVVVSTQ
jgi:molecular chaperone GrpE